MNDLGLVDTAQTAELLGLHRGGITRRCEAGEFDEFMIVINGRYFFRKTDLRKIAVRRVGRPKKAAK